MRRKEAEYGLDCVFRSVSQTKFYAVIGKYLFQNFTRISRSNIGGSTNGR
jgi:hypothetical protein